jgi:hypothetical protein
MYDSVRETCVQFILDLADRVTQHEDRLKRLEERARQDSRTGIAVRVVSCGPRIGWMRSSITFRMRVADAGAGLMLGSANRAGGSVATRSASCRRSA